MADKELTFAEVAEHKTKKVSFHSNLSILLQLATGG